MLPSQRFCRRSAAVGGDQQRVGVRLGAPFEDHRRGMARAVPRSPPARRAAGRPTPRRRRCARNRGPRRSPPGASRARAGGLRRARARRAAGSAPRPAPARTLPRPRAGRMDPASPPRPPGATSAHGPHAPLPPGSAPRAPGAAGCCRPRSGAAGQGARVPQPRPPHRAAGPARPARWRAGRPAPRFPPPPRRAVQAARPARPTTARRRTRRLAGRAPRRAGLPRPAVRAARRGAHAPAPGGRRGGQLRGAGERRWRRVGVACGDDEGPTCCHGALPLLVSSAGKPGRPGCALRWVGSADSPRIRG